MRYVIMMTKLKKKPFLGTITICREIQFIFSGTFLFLFGYQASLLGKPLLPKNMLANYVLFVQLSNTQ